MVIRDLRLVRITVPPDEANPVLIIDPYGVLPRAVIGKLMQPVAGRNLEIVQFFRGVQHDQLTPRGHLEGLEAFDPYVVEQQFGVACLKRSDHMRRL
jgi:hypothetical protein